MKILSIHFNRAGDANQDRSGSIRAFCRLTLSDSDGFKLTIRDVKIVTNRTGEIRVVMPNRQVDFRCDACGVANVWNSKYCNECGSRLPFRALKTNVRGVEIRSYDVIFPSDADSGRELTEAILCEYDRFLAAAR